MYRVSKKCGCVYETEDGREIPLSNTSELKKMSLKHVHIFLETLYISSTIENNKIKNENKDNF